MQQLHYIFTCFGFELSFHQIAVRLQIGLVLGIGFKHFVFTSQHLQTHIRSSNVSTDHQQIVFASTISQYYPCFGGYAQGSNRQLQALLGRGGIAPNQVHTIGFTRQVNACIQLLNSFERKAIGHCY